MGINVGKDEQKALRRALLKYFANAPKQCAVLQFLFDRFIETSGAIEHISEQDIIDDCEGGPKNEGAVRTQINRLRADLAEYFDGTTEGRLQRHKILIPQRSYVVRFERNDPSTPRSPELVNRFWTPYTISSQPVHLYYPEPQFFRDGRETCLHNPAATGSDMHGALSYLGNEGKLSPHYGFVPSGLVQAMVHLFGFFQRTQTPIFASALRPSMEMPEPDQDLIVIATASSAPKLLARLEVTLPMRTLLDSVVCRKDGVEPSHFRDLPSGEGSDPGVDHKWAVLTRRPHRIKGRIITVIAARHARAVEAVAAYLTNERELQQLAQKFNCDDVFPTFLQALFRVPILQTDAEPFIEPITVEDAINLDPLSRSTTVQSSRV